MTHREAGIIGGQKMAAELRRSAREAYYINPKYCKQCGARIDVRENERPSITRARNFCNHSCSATYNNKAHKRVPKCRFCRVCKNQTKSNRLMFCSLECRTEYRKANVGGRPVQHQSARGALIAEYGAKCSKCGWAEVNPVSLRCPIVMNHIDGNSENMAWGNLELLCPNCDSLTPTYKTLNKGNGRHSRMERYHFGKSY